MSLRKAFSSLALRPSDAGLQEKAAVAAQSPRPASRNPSPRRPARGSSTTPPRSLVGFARPYIRYVFHMLAPYRTMADHRVTIKRTNEAMEALATAPARIQVAVAATRPRLQAQATEGGEKAQSLFFAHAYKIYAGVALSYWGYFKLTEKPETDVHPGIALYGTKPYDV